MRDVSVRNQARVRRMHDITQIERPLLRKIFRSIPISSGRLQQRLCGSMQDAKFVLSAEDQKI